MIRAVTIQGDRIAEVDVKLITVGKNNVWVDVVGPSIQELKEIHEKFNIPISELQHCLDPEERPRVKIDQGITYIYYRGLVPEEKKGTVTITFILTKKFIISIHKQKIAAINDLDLSNDLLKTLFKESTEFLIYKILHALSKETNKVVDMLENEVDYVETEVMKRYSDHTLAHIHSLKKKIVYYRRACMADRDVISVMVKEIATIKEKGLFAEIEVEVMQTIDTIELIKERLTSIVEIYVTNTSNRINTVMKSITLLATLLSFPILMTGLYGMNVALPLGEHPHAFWIITGLLILSVITTIIFFARKKWL
ncbi:MAG TPA: magnesium transporter CorA family protein [Candidatus Nanoarchaeia archaeon]|nr:magnesium transporter CorA family protein [Candidatus Nanoarchaeia archaeon]